MRSLPFTVDSALLRELGERLIGKPHIALAELIKNSYDADANEVKVVFDPDADTIEISDDGQGMNLAEFKKYWMRIGNPHKSDKPLSRRLKRPLTGSKGVGRLSVQFLADELQLTSVPANPESKWLTAKINWKKAIQADQLTQVKVYYALHTGQRPFKRGLQVKLSSLRHEWETNSVEDLARELWWLQPPFRNEPLKDDPQAFSINFTSPQTQLADAFNSQLDAIMSIWTARLVGKCENGVVKLLLEFADNTRENHTYRVAALPQNRKQDESSADDIHLLNCNFQIRIFTLAHRQPLGIKVAEAREYFEKYGGVHVYDAGFHLPYYGIPTNDWLQVEYDHAHRLTLSALLPKTLQIARGLNQLPTLGRIFGAVNVNTAREPGLQILITRDRLTDTTAFADLRGVVRYALDYYAMAEARRKVEESLRTRSAEPVTEKYRRIESILEDYEDELPKPMFRELKEGLRDATEAAEREQSKTVVDVGILAPLATAGIAAVAYQHEIRKQFREMERIVGNLRAARLSNRGAISELAEDLERWLTHARATNALFDPLTSAENVARRDRLKVEPIIDGVIQQTSFFSQGVKIEKDIHSSNLRFPNGSLAEWSALLQNVFINAFHAMADSRRRELYISSKSNGRQRFVTIQDTGSGVQLRKSDDLFMPYVRKGTLTPARQAMGFGGAGLGLAIVKLIANNTRTVVKFTEPEKGFATAFQISWKETT